MFLLNELRSVDFVIPLESNMLNTGR